MLDVNITHSEEVNEEAVSLIKEVDELVDENYDEAMTEIFSEAIAKVTEIAKKAVVHIDNEEKRMLVLNGMIGKAMGEASLIQRKLQSISNKNSKLSNVAL